MTPAKPSPIAHVGQTAGGTLTAARLPASNWRRSTACYRKLKHHRTATMIHQGGVMTWIADRIKERDAGNRTKQFITSAAEGVFNTLWKDIEAFVPQANKEGGFALQLDSKQADERKIIKPVSPSAINRLPETLTIRLEKDKGKIVASCFHPPVCLIFSIEVSGRNKDLVDLIHCGNEVSAEKACQLILDPFLFPKD